MWVSLHSPHKDLLPALPRAPHPTGLCYPASSWAPAHLVLTGRTRWRAATSLPREDGDRDGTGGALGGLLTWHRADVLAGTLPREKGHALHLASVLGPLPRGVSPPFVHTQCSPMLRPTQCPAGLAELQERDFPKGVSFHWGLRHCDRKATGSLPARTHL